MGLYNKRFALLFIITLIFSLANVHAIQLLSPRVEIYTFEPNFELEVPFKVAGYNLGTNIWLENDLEDYAEITDIHEHEEGFTTFNVKLMLPETMDEPGVHELHIVAEDIPVKKGMISTVASVAKVIKVRVLMPQKHAKFGINTPDLNVGDKTNFEIHARSETTEYIDSVRADFEISESGGEEVLTTISTEIVPLDSAASYTISAEFDSEGFVAGTYDAKAIVYWDQNITTVGSSFKIGTLSLDLVKYDTNFTNGSIKPFNILVKSGWNDPIEGVYAEVFLGERRIVKTASVDLEPWSEEKLTGYWELFKVPEGQYPVRIVLHLEGKTLTNEGTVLVSGNVMPDNGSDGGSDPSDTNIFIYLIPATVVILFIIGLVAYLVRRRNNYF